MSEYDEDLSRLRMWYHLMLNFLDVHFGSGYVIKAEYETNLFYQKICVIIEKILEKPNFKKFPNNWKPFEHLLDLENDYPEGDWELGVRKNCTAFFSYVENEFLRNGEHLAHLDDVERNMYENMLKFIVNYKEKKKQDDKNFLQTTELLKSMRDTSKDSSNIHTNKLDEEPLEFEVSHEDHTGKIKVFISHKFVTSDQKLADMLRATLKEHNIYGYLAERKKDYDLGWDEKIKQDIESSDYLVAILTKNSLYAPSVHQEIGYAKGVKVPVRILAEGEEIKGVLTQGRDSEKFSRPNFEKYLDNVIKDILKNGIRKKLTPDQKHALIQNVYEPCYNQMMNVFSRREFITITPENPWEKISHSWKHKTELDVRELFEEYTAQLHIWNVLFLENERGFIRNQVNIFDMVSFAFDNEGLTINGHVILDDKGGQMAINDWIREYRYVLFDPRIKNANQLHARLLEFAKVTKNNHEQWLNRFSEKTDLYRTLVKILPDTIEENNIKICDDEMITETQKLKHIIEKLTLVLEQKINL